MLINYFSISRWLLFLTPFILVVVTTSTLFPFIVGKYFFFRLLVGMAMVSFMVGIIMDRKRADGYWERLVSVLRSPLGIAVSAFTFIFLLAGFFGHDPSFSFWSNFERGEGGLQILFLYALFILLATLFNKEEHWRKLFIFAIIAAFLVVFYGIGGGLKHIDMEEGGVFYEMFSNFIGQPLSEITRFQGSLGNPAYLATYLLFAMFFASYLLLSEKQKVKRNGKIALVSSIIIFAFFFFWAATRGAFLGLIGGGLVGAVYLFIVGKKWRKPIVGLVLLGAVVLGGAYMYQEHPVIKDSRIARLFDISPDTKTFRHRAIMWGIAVEGWKERPLLGWGPENYNEIFYRHYNPAYYEIEEGGVGNYGAWFDRAHSTTFEYLSQTGILGLLAYWSIFATLFWLFLKAKLHRRETPFLATLMLVLPIAYLVQGQVLFEVLAIYLPFYIFLGFAAYKLRPEEHETAGEKISEFGHKVFGFLKFKKGKAGMGRNARNAVAGGLIAVMLAFIYLGAFAPLGKAQAYISTVNAMGAGQFATEDEVIGAFERMLDYHSPVGQKEVVRFYAQNLTSMIRNQGEEFPEETLLRLVHHVESWMMEDDLIHNLNMAQIYNTMLQHHPKEEYLNKTVYYYDKVLEIGPKLPHALEGKARLYLQLEGFDEELAEVSARILELWPDHPAFQSE